MIQLIRLMVAFAAAKAAMVRRVTNFEGKPIDLKHEHFANRYYFAYGIIALQRPNSLFMITGRPINHRWMPAGTNLLTQLSNCQNRTKKTVSQRFSSPTTTPDYPVVLWDSMPIEPNSYSARRNQFVASMRKQMLRSGWTIRKPRWWIRLKFRLKIAVNKIRLNKSQKTKNQNTVTVLAYKAPSFKHKKLAQESENLRTVRGIILPSGNQPDWEIDSKLAINGDVLPVETPAETITEALKEAV